MTIEATTGFPKKLKFALIILAGIMQVFSLPNFIWTGYSAWHSWIALLSFVPFILVWRRSQWYSAAMYSWLMGFIYFTGILAWIRLIGRDTNIDNAFAWIFFAICGGVYFALFGFTAHVTKNRLKLPDVIVLPLAWVTWEYLRGHILTGGWPWGSLGHTQYGNTVIRQMASVVGMGGVSYIVITLNVWAANLIEFALQRQPLGSLKERFLKLIAIPQRFREKPLVTSLSLILIAAWVVFTMICLVQTIQFAHAKKSELKLALLQGNINTREKWDRDYRNQAMAIMTRLHLQAAEKKPDMIVWAESCFPGMLEHPGYMQWENQLRTLVKKAGIPTLLTSNEYQKEKNLESRPKWHHYNSAFYLGAQGQTRGRYRKIRLVPFGEYIPYNFLKKYLKTVVQEPIPIDFEPGDDYSVFSLGGSKFSTLICYEDVFEELGYHLAHEGADFFVCVANNSWSGKSAMSYQHTAMSVFLAVEHRAYVAKADMTGPTCVIDPWGNVGKPMTYFTQGVKQAIIYPTTFRTFFTRFGNIVPFSFTLLFFGLFATVFYRPRKKPGQPPQA